MEKKTVAKNIFYSMLSNTASIVISAVVALIVPRVLGVRDYGFFQLFLFYSSYTGFLYIGWGDGVYLRYGGAYYDKLNKNKISAQFWGIGLFALIVALLIIALSQSLINDEQRQYIWLCIGIYIVIMWPKTILTFILQCTNRIKEYSFIVLIERVAYLAIVISLIITGQLTLRLIINADILGRLLSLIIGMWYCKDLVLSRPEPIGLFLEETAENIKIGSKLMLSNIASMLIVGISRFFIEHHWDISTFGKVSLSLSLSNMIMTFLNAIALVMFPTLRRLEKEKYALFYKTTRDVVVAMVLIMLLSYYPLKMVLAIWIPKYNESLEYMAILFPICLYESVNGMLAATYLKTLRKEKLLLKINSMITVASFLVTWFSVYVLDSIKLTLVSIVVLLALRCFVTEREVSKYVDLSLTRDMIEETLMVIIFIGVNWIVGDKTAAVIYLTALVLYLLSKRKDYIEVKKRVFR